MDLDHSETAGALTVLLVSNHGEIIGGGEISLLTLLQGLKRSQWNPHVAVPSDGTMASRCRGLGLPVHIIPLPSLRRPGLGMLRAVIRLCRLIRVTGANLLHANGSRAMFYAGLAAALCQRPAIWHLRILEVDPKLDWLLSRLATRTIATSEAVRARLRQRPEAYRRCIVVPNGLDLSAFSPSTDSRSTRRSLDLGPNDRIIGTVGRLVPFKGHRFLLEAFEQLQRQTPRIRLLIVGDGPERQRLEEYCRHLGIAEAVQFTGHREDVADLLALLDIFVLPSLGEHFGRVLLEAMALRLPVVATAAGGVPEVIEANVTGLLVPPADAGALAGAIASLLADPDRARAMGLAGRRRVEENYTLASHSQRVQSLYQEILTSGD